jgi:hypothetical protein
METESDLPEETVEEYIDPRGRKMRRIIKRTVVIRTVNINGRPERIEEPHEEVYEVPVSDDEQPSGTTVDERIGVMRVQKRVELPDWEPVEVSHRPRRYEPEEPVEPVQDKPAKPVFGLRPTKPSSEDVIKPSTVDRSYTLPEFDEQFMTDEKPSEADARPKVGGLVGPSDSKKPKKAVDERIGVMRVQKRVELPDWEPVEVSHRPRRYEPEEPVEPVQDKPAKPVFGLRPTKPPSEEVIKPSTVDRSYTLPEFDEQFMSDEKPSKADARPKLGFEPEEPKESTVSVRMHDKENPLKFKIKTVKKSRVGHVEIAPGKSNEYLNLDEPNKVGIASLMALLSCPISFPLTCMVFISYVVNMLF